MKITRKMAEEVLLNWRRHLLSEEEKGQIWNQMHQRCFESQKEKFIQQFPDEPDQELKIYCEDCEGRGYTDFDLCNCGCSRERVQCLSCNSKGYTVISQAITLDAMLDEMRQ